MRHVSIWVAAFILISILSAKADIEVINNCMAHTFPNLNAEINARPNNLSSECTFESSQALKSGSQKIKVTVEKDCDFLVSPQWIEENDTENGRLCRVSDGATVVFQYDPSFSAGDRCNCFNIKKTQNHVN